MQVEALRPLTTTLRILYPIWAMVGMFSLIYVPSQVFVQGDITETAARIQSMEGLFRLGILGSLVTQLIFILTAWYLFRFFRQTHQQAAQLMLILALVSVPMAILNELFSLSMLQSTDNLSQLQLLRDLHRSGLQIVMLFWGLWLFPLGYLIMRSGYFLRIIGWFAIAGGVGYVLGFFLDMLGLQIEWLSTIAETLTLGEVLWLLWLIIAGARLPD
ncbi:MAG TPA: DUF4386 domain-containing protein [Saprospiraceae bacterium]|nr:DUF4386 domain-containing protein [Saprospiraceae bacterium]